jgi:7,8-dihydropterin-6-yl-methyl-4-(beta-D-ribofuranosyl)aminobenzene 5'-phosphate synthase
MSKYQLSRVEQAQAVNVDGVGLVLITGCGHPGVQNMLDRAAMLFDQPVVDIVGGLHYSSQNKRALQGDIDLLKARNLRLLSISPYDTVSDTIQIFRDEFPGICQDLMVGREINFSAK